MKDSNWQLVQNPEKGKLNLTIDFQKKESKLEFGRTKLKLELRPKYLSDKLY
jgi:hypothetical protein